MENPQTDWPQLIANYPDLVPPRPSSLEAFPESIVSAKGINTIQADFGQRCCMMHLGVEYAYKSGIPLHLQIIEPRQAEDEEILFPLILYVQGSAWFKQNTGNELAQLSRFARRGFVIAVVEYRPSTLAPFPAQVKDTKTALRYMKAHAETYHADPERIILWGDSSGGHTSVMTSVTLDNQELDDESPIEKPILLRAVIDYYGPTDISTMNQEPSTQDHVEPASPEGMLIGGFNILEHPSKVAPTITTSYLSEDRAIPPMLIMHGSRDRLVPFGQSVMLFNALKKMSKTAECYQLKGADHAGPPFWTEPVLDIVEAFINRWL